MDHWRLLIVCFAALAAILALAGCGGGGEGDSSQETGAATSCQDAISRDEAHEHVGEQATVRGLVLSARHAPEIAYEPTFLEMGGYVKVIIWGEDRGNFPEPPEQAYDGKTICVTGLIEKNFGWIEMIAASPSDIEIAG